MKKLAAFLALLCWPALAQQVTSFPAANTPLSGSEQLYLVQNGQGRQTTIGAIASGIGSTPVGGPNAIQFYGTAIALAGSQKATLDLNGNMALGGTLNVTGAITGSLTGHASLDLALTGGTLTGSLTAPSLIPNGSSVPSLGLYNPTTNTWGLSASSTLTLEGRSTTVTVPLATASTTSGNGAFVVTGGVGIGGAVNVGGATSLAALTASSILVSGTGQLNIGNPAGTNSGFRVQPASGLGTPVLSTYGPTGAVGLNVNLQNLSGGADGLFQVLNPVKIAPGSFAWSGAYQPALFGSSTLTGTATGAGAAVNQFTIGESVDASALSTSMVGFNILHDYGGGTTKGGRVGFQSSLVQQGGANADGSADNFYVGAAFSSFGRYGQSGATSTAPLGRIFGFNAVGEIQTGFTATNLFQVAGGEVNFGISSGSSSFIRSGLTIADLNGVVQGFGADNGLWFYGGGAPLRNGIMWGDTQEWSIDATVGAMLNANIGGAGYNARPFQAKWGIKFDQVIYPSTGNPYDGGFFATNGASMDGAGTLRLGTTYLTSSSTGLGIDAKGSLGNGVSIATAGTGYTLGVSTVVVTEYGGYWLVNVNGSGVPTSVSALVQPQWPSTSSPPATATPTVLNPLETGTGLVLNLTWDTTATTLALNPSGGATTVGGSLGLGGALKYASSTTGAGAQTFTNSPCTGLTTERWVGVQINGQSGTWYVPACQ